MKILAIESSCDDTAAAVVEDGRRVLSSVIASQVPEKYAETAALIIKEEMENTVALAVKFAADTAVGKSWYDAKD